MSYLAKTPEDLLPCPHCGGEAKAFFCEESGTYDVQCQQCGALPFLGRKRGSGHFKSMDDVIAAWNRRAERTCRVGCYPPGYEDNLHYEVCSECGTILTASRPGDRHSARASYCPRCGARVVDE